MYRGRNAIRKVEGGKEENIEVMHEKENDKETRKRYIMQKGSR